MVKIIVQGIPEVQKMLKNASKEVEERADKGILKAAAFLRGEIVESIAGQREEPTSVDTGAFKQSISHKKTDKMEAIVEDGVPYGIFLEYGTTKIPARAHFRNSAQRNEENLKNIVKQEIGAK